MVSKEIYCWSEENLPAVIVIFDSIVNSHNFKTNFWSFRNNQNQTDIIKDSLSYSQLSPKSKTFEMLNKFSHFRTMSKYMIYLNITHKIYLEIV